MKKHSREAKKTEKNGPKFKILSDIFTEHEQASVMQTLKHLAPIQRYEKTPLEHVSAPL